MSARRLPAAIALAVAACLAHPFEPTNALPLVPIPQGYTIW